MAVGGFSSILANIEEHGPLRRNVTGQDVGETARYLLSDMGRGVTGQIIRVDCGTSAVAGSADQTPRAARTAGTTTDLDAADPHRGAIASGWPWPTLGRSFLEAHSVRVLSGCSPRSLCSPSLRVGRSGGAGRNAWSGLATNRIRSAV